MTQNGLRISGGVLVKNYSRDPHITIPKEVKCIGDSAFEGCYDLKSVRIPDHVTEIRGRAFKDCVHLESITIPEETAVIGEKAFANCRSLVSVKGGNNLKRIENGAFDNCVRLESFSIPDSVTEIGESAFCRCRSLASIRIPDGAGIIRSWTFFGCTNLATLAIPDSVTEIGEGAFYDCVKLNPLRIPAGVTKIGSKAFYACRSLTALSIPEKITEIGDDTFSGCSSLPYLILSGRITRLGENAFSSAAGLTVICPENSAVHQYCKENKVRFLFDYQFEAFHGMIPPGIETLSSPFLADEEKPYIFISYSHKDRDTVLGIIKTLYESGWKIWYDEGLTIGDRYDETLENHVRNCAAFLLFVSKNSVRSRYCREKEIPWAVGSGKPILKCILDQGKDIDIDGRCVAATVGVSGIESGLEKISGLKKGEKRTARGISVAVNPADRKEAGPDDDEGEGIAYCLYAEKNAAAARAILYEAKSSGCALYDAQKEGADETKLRSSPCLVVFLDQAFLSDHSLMEILTEAWRSGRDLAVCQLEEIQDKDLPPELVRLHLMQWLNFVHGMNKDMITKLARHLQKRGCRETAVLPGFDYEINEKGILLKRYTGTDPNPVIESEYSGRPVAEIGEEAFKNCGHLKTVTIRGGVTKIGNRAFMDCSGLSSVSLPDSVAEIGENAFRGCTSLPAVSIPAGMTAIQKNTFAYSGLVSMTIPDHITEIGETAFLSCKSLKTLVIPASVNHIGHMAFGCCDQVTVYCPPDSYAWKKAVTFSKKLKPLSGLNRPGFFSRLLGKK